MGFNEWPGERSMRSYLTSKRLMTKLGMLRSGKKSKALVVVEGMTDYRVYGKLFDLTSCEVIIGESKENVVEAIKMCEEENLQGIIGIVDADFWHVQSTFTQLPKALFMTDYHDLECMMLHSKAFEYVFLEYGDYSKLAHFERNVQTKLIEWMLQNVARIGYLRKVSLEKNLELRFSQLNLENFVEPHTLEIQDERMIQEILFTSRKQNQYKAKQVKKWLQEIEQEIQRLRVRESLWQVCCGHDLMEWLTLAFVQHVGNYNAKKLFSGQLEGSFRLTYHQALFKETQLYRDLKVWEQENSKYHLLITSDINEFSE